MIFNVENVISFRTAMIQELKSFDGSMKVNTRVDRPGKYSELFDVISTGRFIPRGAGLSYCLASAGNDAVSIDNHLFNRVLNFDEANGTIRVEPGINLGDLLNIIIPKGWFFPVLPGYPKITIGGCIGFNIHGKSQYDIGLFSDYVNNIKIVHPNHGEFTCSGIQNPDVFFLTMGGFGLTGLVTEVELKLRPLKAWHVSRKKVFIGSLSEAVEVMENLHNESDNIYSWNNLNCNHKNFGKGVIYIEKYIKNDKLYMPVNIKYKNLNSDNRGNYKFCFFNNLTAEIECSLFLLKERLSIREEILPVTKASFPINGKEIYFKLFGEKGLREYQLIIPYDKWECFEKDFIKLKISEKAHFTLGSLKLFKGKRSFLNFQMDGICLAFDMVASKRSLVFFSHVDDLVIKHGGIANISKDSRLNGTILEKMYPMYNDFKEKLRLFEGNFPLDSYLRQRLKI